MSHDRDPLEAWLDALETRHFRDLTFAEVRHGLQALSSLYVERRGNLAAGRALEGRGKRAAFALYYGPLHFMLVREVVRALAAARPSPDAAIARIVDLGCGTGAAGAAWALAPGAGAGALAPAARARVDGIDRSPWAVEEAGFAYRALGIAGSARRADAGRVELPGAGAAIVAAFTLNELGDGARAGLLERMLGAARRGARVLVVEPIARRPVPWWDGAAAAFLGTGGRADEWRFRAALPEPVRRLGLAAGLNPRELLGRSLSV